MNKNGFIFYSDWYHLLKSLNKDQKAIFLDCLLEYEFNGQLPIIEDPALNGIWCFIKEQLDRNRKKYTDFCEKQRERANKRWEKENAEECTGMPTHTENADKDKDKDKDNVKDKYSKDFEKFWSIYPKRGNETKYATYQSYKKAIKIISKDNLLEAAKQYSFDDEAIFYP